MTQVDEDGEEKDKNDEDENVPAHMATSTSSLATLLKPKNKVAQNKVVKIVTFDKLISFEF